MCAARVQVGRGRRGMQAINAWLLLMMSSGWGLGVLALAAFLDALIVPIPTELAVLAAASAFRAHGSPALPLLVLVCTGAFAAGDACTYLLGGLLPVERIHLLRRGRGRVVLLWAFNALGSHAGAFTVASRFVPAGRTVMNLVAGSMRYPFMRYVRFSLVAGFAWSVYMWLLGYLAAGWFTNNPLAVMAAGFVIGGAVGSLCDAALRSAQHSGDDR